MADINEILVKLSLSNNEYLQKIEQAKKATANFATSIQGAFSTVQAFAAGAGIGAAFKFMIDKAEAAELAQIKLNATLESTGHIAGLSANELNKYAEQLSKTTTFSKTQLLGAENALLRFTNVHKNEFPGALKAIADYSAATGTDLVMATTKVGRALQDPINGMTALRREGIKLSEQQQSLVKNYIQHNQFAKAQEIVLGALNKRYGDQAEILRGTLTGQIQILENQMGSLAAEAGGQLLPQITSLVTTFNSASSGGVSVFSVAISACIAPMRALLNYAVWTIDKVKEAYDWATNAKQSSAMDFVKSAVKTEGAKGGSYAPGAYEIPKGASDAESFAKKQSEMNKKLAQDAVNTVKEITSSISSVLENVYSNINASFDRMVQKRDEEFEYLRNLAIKSAGVTEETDKQKYAKSESALTQQISRESNMKKKAELQDQLNTLHSEQKRTEITKKYQLAQKAFDMEMHIQKNAMMKKQFENEKAMKLAQAGINMAAGIAGAWVSALSMIFPPLVIAMGAVMTALIAASGISQMAVIASTQFTPQYETGTDYVPYTGPAIVHEGEMIFNRQQAESVRDNMTNQGVNVHVSGHVLDGRGLVKIVKEAFQSNGVRMRTAGAY